MRKGRPQRGQRHRAVHPPTMFQRLVERIRGRDQLLVQPGEGLPLLLITYPAGKAAVAREVETAFAHRLPQLPHRLKEAYSPTLAALPVMVVVILRPFNTCGCLGHLHPRGTESRLAKRLSADLGAHVGEIDLAYEEIRQWQPRPLSSLATGDLGDRLKELHFEAALLAVLLHELQHVAFPDTEERDIRGRSDDLYHTLMEEMVQRESGHGYSMTPPSSDSGNNPG